MRYGTKTLVGWMLVATALHVVTYRMLARPDLWWDYLLFYAATTLIPGGWTWRFLRRHPAGAAFDAWWLAWAPTIGGMVTFAAVSDLLLRVGRIY